MKNNSRSKATNPAVIHPLTLPDDSLFTQSDDSFSIDSLASFQKPKRVKKQEEMDGKEEESFVLSEFDPSATLESIGIHNLAESVVKNQEDVVDYSTKSQEDGDNFSIRELPLDDYKTMDETEEATFHKINHRTVKAELSALSCNKEEQWEEEQEYFQGSGNKEIMERLRKQMKKIDEEVRTLTSQKNKLKYLLRKQEGTLGEGEGEPQPTKQCPCCNKDISKLCFRCEHTYCEPQQCTRKKKQFLNARMLSKMKEKKGSRDSKKEQLKRKKERKARELLPLVQEESEPSFDSFSSSLESSNSSKQHPQQEHQNPPPAIPDEPSSFSSLSSNTFMNLSLTQTNNSLYFQQQSTR